MGNTWIIDIRHFLSDSRLPPIISGSARRIAEYFGKIISASSIVEPGVEFRVSIHCRRRPGRKRCSGTIIMYRNDDDSEIIWRCSVCGDNGIISNWQGTVWDLRIDGKQADSLSRT